LEFGPTKIKKRRAPVVKTAEAALRRQIAKMASEYGHRRVTAFLRQAGWKVNHKRVERIWCKDGLKVRHMQPKRWRL
jgi:transposase InsO family protein